MHSSLLSLSHGAPKSNVDSNRKYNVGSCINYLWSCKFMQSMTNTCFWFDHHFFIVFSKRCWYIYIYIYSLQLTSTCCASCIYLELSSPNITSSQLQSYLQYTSSSQSRTFRDSAGWHNVSFGEYAWPTALHCNMGSMICLLSDVGHSPLLVNQMGPNHLGLSRVWTLNPPELWLQIPIRRLSMVC